MIEFKRILSGSEDVVMDDTITAVKAVSLAARMISGSGGETYRAEETVRLMFNGFG